MAGEAVRYELLDGGVAKITLDDPETRNALSAELLGGLAAALREARESEQARAVILASSHERVFSAGANLQGFGADVPLIHKHFATEGFVEIFRDLCSFPKPTICAARGHVLAGALGIALACDLVIAGEEASFGLPEIGIGAFPFMVMALLYRNVGRKRANELLLLGERIDAVAARECGIVNRVVPPEQVDAAALQWALKLAGRSAVIMRLGKEAMRAQMDMEFDAALDHLRAQLTLALSTEDIIEGVSAFFEKREPVWRNR